MIQKRYGIIYQSTKNNITAKEHNEALHFQSYLIISPYIYKQIMKF